MARLFRLENSGELVRAEEKPFLDEVSEMEPFIMKNPSLLGDVFIFAEQVTSSGRDKRTDLVAVDKNREIQIIELKKDKVGTEVLSQSLGYQVFWKKHPDSAKSLWATRSEKTIDIEPDWENYHPGIVIVAPLFDDELIEIASEKDLGMRFIEISRYLQGNSTLIFVNEVGLHKVPQSPVTSRKDYDWTWFEQQVANSGQLRIAKRLYEQIISFCQAKGWTIEPKFNKFYITFKSANHNMINSEFRHRGKVAIVGTTLNEKNEDPSKLSDVSWQWDNNWQEWVTEIDKEEFDINRLDRVLEKAHDDTLR